MKTKRVRYLSPILVNAEHMAKQNPDTFWIPQSRHSLKAGDLVKVDTDGERFWCLIEKVVGGIYFAEVRNALLFTDGHGLEFGSKIKFAPDNVYQAMRNGEYLE